MYILAARHSFIWMSRFWAKRLGFTDMIGGTSYWADPTAAQASRKILWVSGRTPQALRR